MHNLKLLTVECLLFPGELDGGSLQPRASPWVQSVELGALPGVTVAVCIDAL